jgi:hypothetical protein
MRRPSRVIVQAIPIGVFNSPDHLHIAFLLRAVTHPQYLGFSFDTLPRLMEVRHDHMPENNAELTRGKALGSFRVMFVI